MTFQGYFFFNIKEKKKKGEIKDKILNCNLLQKDEGIYRFTFDYKNQALASESQTDCAFIFIWDTAVFSVNI